MTALLLAVALARAEVSIDPEPARGQESVVSLADDRGRPLVGRTVQVVYGPGLARERHLAIGITDGRGRVRWTPDQGGVVAVRAEDRVYVTAIGWPSVPVDTALLLGVLGIAGAVALGYGLWPRRHHSPSSQRQ